MIHELNSVDEVLRVLVKFPSTWAFRGQSDSTWNLESALERALKKQYAQFACQYEKLALAKLDESGHLYISNESLPSSKLGKLALLQHHGVPTRLLDFTSSPFIAMFFAIFEYISNKPDVIPQFFTIHCIDYRKLMVKTFTDANSSCSLELEYPDDTLQSDKLFDSLDRKKPLLLMTEPGKLNRRLERQKGTFLISCSFELTISEALTRYPEDIHIQLNISTDLVHKLWHALESVVTRLTK